MRTMSRLMSVFLMLIPMLLVNNAFSQQIVINERPSLGGLSSPSAVGVDPRLINAAMSFPITVPQGINGIQPGLVVGYDANSQNTFLGVGWDIAVDAIERSTRRGVPRYDSADAFVLVQSGSPQDLIYDSAAGTYHPDVEETFKKIEFLTDQWVITDRQGTRYFFGTTSDAKQYADGASNNVFKWLLNRVEDVHGNYMTISYTRDGNQNYLHRIEYTGNQNTGSAPFAQVDFELATRAVPYQSYQSGFLIKTLKRIAGISVRAQGALQRRYEFNYTQSPSTQRDLLSSIKQYGSDGATSLPATLFTYYGAEKGFNVASAGIPAAVQFSKAVSGGNADLGVRIADVNGDGYPDILKSYITIPEKQETRGVYLNNKNNTWSLSSPWGMPEVCPGDNYVCTTFIDEITSASITSYIDYGVRVADIDGDSRMDIVNSLHVQGDNNGSTYNYLRKSSFLNIGTGWGAYNSSWYLPSGAEFMSFYSYLRGSSFGWKYEFLGDIFSDVNNDGYTDIVTSKKAVVTPDMLNSTVVFKKTYLNNIPGGGTGWSLNADWTPPNTAYTDLSAGATLIDLNGDSLPDIYYLVGNAAHVYMNTGNGWQEDLQSPWRNTFSLGDLANGTTQFGDVNGDGLADMIIAKGNYSSGSRVLINTSNGWFEDPAWAFPEGTFANLGLRLLDANADNLLDFMIHYNGQTPKLYLNQGKTADLLKVMDNGYGGLTTLEYGSSAQVNNTFLPFAFPVITAVTRSTTLPNGQSDSYRTRFDYANGLWVPAERKFRGFGTIKITDPEGNYIETDYLQDPIKKGKIAEQRTYDSTGRLMTKLIHTWDYQSVAPGTNFVFLKQKDNLVFGSNGSIKRSQEKYSYQEPIQLGNLTKTVQLGEVNPADGADIGNDTRTVETSYLNNTSAGHWLIGFPRLITVKNNNNEFMRKTWFNYDNQDNTTAPLRGLLTKQEQWAGDQPGAVNPVTTYTYDGYGNLLTTTDPLGKTSSVTYDSALKLFALSTRNPLNHVETREYYGVNGVPLDSGDGLKGLWGQLKSATDANNHKTRNTYDVFGRMVSTVSPLDSITYPTTAYQYQFASSYLKTTTRQRVNNGQPGTIDRLEFTDGLGRMIQTKTPSAVSGQFIVSGQTKYNSRGLPSEKYLPFFSTNSLDTIESINAGRAHYVIAYDALGRIVRNTNPDGTTYSTVEYDAWTSRTIDENGHQQESDYDAFGRLTERREYAGANGRFASRYPVVSFVPYAVTRYGYDSEGGLVKVIDTNGDTTIITYDKLGQKTSVDDPDMGLWQYTYDLNGNLKTQTDAKNHTINFDYDAINRLKLKWDDQGIDNSYTYDDQPNATGRLTKVTFTDGERRFEYDALGRTIQEDRVIDDNLYPVRYQYNALDAVDHIQYPDSGEVFYQYDNAGQPSGAAEDPALFDQQSSLMEPEQENFWAGMRQKAAAGLKTAARAIIDEGTGLFFATAAYADEVPLDYTSFTETDPMGKITMTSSCVSFDDIPTRGQATYSYRSFNTAGDFVFEFDTILTSSDTFSGETTVWGVTNTAADTYDNWMDGAQVVWYKAGATVRLELEKISPYSGDNSITLSMNQRYYVRVSRAGDIVTAQIYSDAARTQLVDTLTRDIGSGGYAYLYGFSNEEYAITGRAASGDVCRLSTGTPSAGDTAAPTTPTNVNFNNAAPTSLTLNWSASTDNVGVTGYRIDIATDSGFNNIISGYNNLAVGNVLTKGVTGLSAGTTYYGRARAYDAAGNTSGNSATASGTTIAAADTTAPSTPSSVNFSDATQTSLALNWSASTDNVGVTGYRIDIATDSGFNNKVSGYNNLDVGNALSKFVPGLSAGTTYYGRVRAYDAAGNTSGNSATASGTTTAAADTIAPSTPTNVNFSNAAQTSLTLNWSASTDNVGVTGYRIDIATDSGFNNKVSGYNNLDVGNVLTKGVPGLSAGTTYYGRARAYDAAGNTSGNSSTASAATLSAPSTGMTRLDYTAFTEIDPLGGITRTPDCVIFDNIETRNQATTVSRPETVDGDFVFEFDTMLISSDTFSGETVVWGASNTGAATYNNWGDGITVSYYVIGTTRRLELENHATASADNSTNLNLNQRYYLRVSRTGDMVTAEIYSDAARTQIVDTLTKQTGSGSYAYLYGFSTEEATSTGKKASGDVCRLSASGTTPSYVLSVTKTGTGTGTVTSVPAGINCGATCAAGFSEGTSVTLSAAAGTGAGFAGWSGAGCSGTGTCSILMDAAKGVTATFNDITAPPVPTALTATEAGSDAIDLSWAAVADTGGSGLQGYNIYRLSGASYVLIKNVAAPAVSTSDSGLAGATTYTYKITSIDQAGNESAMSGAASQTTPSSGAAGFVTDIQYNAAGLKTRVEYGNGVVTTYTYDANLRLKTLITLDAGGNHIQHLTYNYDGVGNVTDITDGLTGEVREFFYDALNRLSEARGNYGPGQTYTTLSYAYEANGNIARKDGLDYTYDRTGDKPHAVRAVGPDSFDYDANGNMITRTRGGETTTYAYDAENHLNLVSEESFSTQYSYDDTGARTLKETPGVTTAFVGELFEDSGIVTRRYVFVGGTRVAEVNNGALAYYHPDHLGGMNVTTNAAGTVADRAEYKPFGEFARHDYPVAEGPYFTDQYRDNETELYYYGARYYNSAIGRFIQPDTIVQEPGNSQSLNRYSYAWNNPVNNIDPSGNFTIGGFFQKCGR